MKIALRLVIADRAAVAALPTLLEILRRHRAHASFLAAPRWLPTLQEAPADGHEVGILSTHDTRWRRCPGPVTLESALETAIEAYGKIFGHPPKLHGSSGCATVTTLRLTQRLNFAWASDSAGRHPFLPLWQGEIIRCPQIPVTLPTLPELAALARQGGESRLGLPALVGKMLAHTTGIRGDQVFSLQPDRKLIAHAAAIEELFTGWREQGRELIALQTLAAPLDIDKLPRHDVLPGDSSSRSAGLLQQGDSFLSAWR